MRKHCWGYFTFLSNLWRKCMVSRVPLTWFRRYRVPGFESTSLPQYQDVGGPSSVFSQDPKQIKYCKKKGFSPKLGTEPGTSGPRPRKSSTKLYRLTISIMFIIYGKCCTTFLYIECPFVIWTTIMVNMYTREIVMHDTLLQLVRIRVLSNISIMWKTIQYTLSVIYAVKTEPH